MPKFEPIAGRYFSVDIEGAAHRIFIEEAGAGRPLLCLHTAGADSRQYRHLLNDRELIGRFRIIAFDLPYHGRSTPPDGWWLKKYRLMTTSYLAMIRAVWRTLGLDRPVVMGCSMGGAIVLKLAAEYQEELTGIVGLESSAYAPGRYTSSCITQRSTGASLPPATPTASTRRIVPSRTDARTGGTTANRGPAYTRATSISTATTGTGAKPLRASTPVVARSRCSPANTIIPVRRR
jgi:pimeloyl-ACP methyl ester carboxylesterase